jgi:hemerythrin
MEAPWNSRHDSGIGIIDEQHSELFRMVAELRDLVQARAARERVEFLLNEMLAASERHFATEEGFMRRFAYPDLDRHAAEHRTMLQSLAELRTTFVESDHAMLMMVPIFLEGWLKHHTSDGDFGFISFLKAHRLV